MTAARRLATYEDLQNLGEGVRAEIIDGALVELVPPMPEHGHGASQIITTVNGPFGRRRGPESPGGWWILSEVDVRLQRHLVVRPDVAGWRRERLPTPWGVRPLDVAPGWICEVISTSNEAHDRVTKRRLYSEAGVAHYWLLDNAARVLEALALVEGRWVEVGVYDDQSIARIAPFEAIEIDVGELFPPRQPTATESE